MEREAGSSPATEPRIPPRQFAAFAVAFVALAIIPAFGTSRVMLGAANPGSDMYLWDLLFALFAGLLHILVAGSAFLLGAAIGGATAVRLTRNLRLETRARWRFASSLCGAVVPVLAIDAALLLQLL